MEEQDEELVWHRVDEAGMMGLNFVEDGGLQRVNVEGNILCIGRRGDRLFAVRNRCPHAAGPLHQGWIDENGLLVCPLHRFKFCVDDAGCADTEGMRLQKFPIRVHEDELQIGLRKRKKWLGLF